MDGWMRCMGGLQRDVAGHVQARAMHFFPCLRQDERGEREERGECRLSLSVCRSVLCGVCARVGALLSSRTSSRTSMMHLADGDALSRCAWCACGKEAPHCCAETVRLSAYLLVCLCVYVLHLNLSVFVWLTD